MANPPNDRDSPSDDVSCDRSGRFVLPVPSFGFYTRRLQCGGCRVRFILGTFNVVLPLFPFGILSLGSPGYRTEVGYNEFRLWAPPSAA